MAHYSGKSGDCIFGSTALNVKEWTANDNTAFLETTDKADGGFRTGIPGIASCDADVKAEWDSVINPGNPPLVRSGISSTLTLEIQEGGDTLSGEFIIESVDYTSAVNGVVSYSFKAKSTGAYSLPGESGS